MFSLQKIFDKYEAIDFVGGLHWVVAVKGFVYAGIIICALLYVPNMVWNNFAVDLKDSIRFFIEGIHGLTMMQSFVINLEVIVLCMMTVGFVFAVVQALYFVILWASTVLIVADNRLVYKTGLLFVDVEEIEIEEIEKIHVVSGLLGNLLDYAYIYIDTRFVNDASMHCIAKPYQFMKSFHKMHDDHNNAVA